MDLNKSSRYCVNPFGIRSIEEVEVISSRSNFLDRAEDETGRSRVRRREGDDLD